MSKSFHQLSKLYESVILEHTIQKQSIVIDPSKGDKEFQTQKFLKEFKDLGGKSKQIKQLADNLISNWRAAKGVNQNIFELKFTIKVNLESLPIEMQSLSNIRPRTVEPMPLYGVEVLKRNPPVHLLAIKIPSSLLKKPNTSAIVWLRVFDDYTAYERILTQLRGGM